MAPRQQPTLKNLWVKAQTEPPTPREKHPLRAAEPQAESPKSKENDGRSPLHKKQRKSISREGDLFSPPSDRINRTQDSTSPVRTPARINVPTPLPTTTPAPPSAARRCLNPLYSEFSQPDIIEPINENYRPPPPNSSITEPLFPDTPGFSEASLVRSESLELNTPIPIPRHSMPADLTFRTPVLLGYKPAVEETHHVRQGALHRSVPASLFDSQETQERPQPPDEPIGLRKEGNKKAKKERKTNGKSNMSIKESMTADECLAVDSPVDSAQSSEEVKEEKKSSPKPLLSILQTHDKSSAATTTGSLFSSSLISTGTSDLSSPSFDPQAFEYGEVICASKTAGGQNSFRLGLVASTFDKIEALKGSGPGSKKKTAVLLANLYRVLLWWCPEDLIPTVYFCLNKVAADYEGLEIGVGDGMLEKIVAEIYGRSDSSIKAALKEYEDLGRVAELSRCSMRQLFKPKPLSIESVFRDFKTIAETSGKSSQDRKKDMIKKMLAAAEKSEPKLIIRFLQAKLRMGVQSASIFQALGFAFGLTKPKRSPFCQSPQEPCSDIRRLGGKKMPPANVDALLSGWETSIRSALSEVSNVEVVIKHLFQGCDAAMLVEKCVVTPGIPVQPMLAKPTKGLQEVFNRFSDCEFTCEFKYDGERAQVHLLPNKSVVVFSRNLENLTEKYPDVLIAAKKAFNPDVTECILDSEVVAYDCKSEKIQPFQVLSTRKRKGVEAEDVTVKVCIFAFDCIQYNGVGLTKKSLAERRTFLQQCFTEVPNEFMFAKHAELTTMEDVDGFLQEAIDGNCEGLMVKTLATNASYEPSKRSLNWLKIKKDYLENLTDSMDLVPIGAFLGRGKRAKVYGAYLLACYNVDEEMYQTVCKAGTGFSDDKLTELYNQLQEKVTTTKDPAYQVHEKLVPDVWFQPSVVWEIRAADLSISPIHTGAFGLKSEGKGIGLRFPRFVRERDDKKPEQATTSYEIADLYESQFKSGSHQDTKKVDESD